MSDKRLSWTLPGHGKDCGRRGFSTIGHLSGPGVHVHRAPNACVNRDCPEHYHRWVNRQAQAIVNRIKNERFVQRVVVSFETTELVGTEIELRDRYRQCYNYLGFVGVRGGVVLFHHDRIPSKFNDREDIDSGPHFHCLVDSPLDPEKVLCVYEQTGIVIKGMGRPRDLGKHARYVLSHLGVPREIVPGGVAVDLDLMPLNPALDGIIATKLHTIRWFGTWCRLKTPEETGRFCKICGCEVPHEDWHHFQWIKLNADPPEKDWIVGSLDDWVQRNEYGYGE